jgi:hypothetical protein
MQCDVESVGACPVPPLPLCPLPSPFLQYLGLQLGSGVAQLCERSLLLHEGAREEPPRSLCHRLGLPRCAQLRLVLACEGRFL